MALSSFSVNHTKLGQNKQNHQDGTRKTLYKASAPGSLMLLGEHAVLNNKKALVLAVNKRIRVTLTERKDNQVLIESVLGKLNFILSDLNKEGDDRIESQKSLQFVLAAVKHFLGKITHGFELMIESEFSDQVGLGSSAAVTVATLAVLTRMCQDPTLPKEDMDYFGLFSTAKALIQMVQGVGSGADVAASVYGGLVVYHQQQPNILKTLQQLPPITVLYTGYKTPTPFVIQQVKMAQSKNAAIFDNLYTCMETCVREAIPAIEQQNWQHLGNIFNIHQGLMNALGVSTPHLDQLVAELREIPGIWGAKISGAGLGDCIIGIGKAALPFEFEPKKALEDRFIPVCASLEGMRYE